MNVIEEGDAASTQSQAHTLHTDKINERVQSLPQELFDKIYDLTFTTESEGATDAGHDIHRIERGDYMPPSLLQVSRATRAAFAKSYYGKGTGCSQGTTFYVDRGDFHAWMLSLTSNHVRFLKDVRICDYNFIVHGPRCVLSDAYDEDDLEDIIDILYTFSWCDLRHVISIRVCDDETNEGAWKKLGEVENNQFW